MNKVRFLITGIVIFFAVGLQAQVSVTMHIGVPPPWGPAGYSEARYYYLPDVEAYYDVRSSMFIYNDGRTWIQRTQLPPRFRNFDLYGGYKVIMTNDYGNKPYEHFKEHRQQYGRGYRGDMQHTIGERPGRNHQGNRENGRGNDRNMRRGNDQGDGHGNKNGEGHGKGGRNERK